MEQDVRRFGLIQTERSSLSRLLYLDLIFPHCFIQSVKSQVCCKELYKIETVACNTHTEPVDSDMKLLHSLTCSP